MEKTIRKYFTRRLGRDMERLICTFLLPKSLYKSQLHLNVFKQIRYETSLLKNALNNMVKNRKYTMYIHRPSFNNVSPLAREYRSNHDFAIYLLLVKGSIQFTKLKRIAYSKERDEHCKCRNRAIISEQKYMEKKIQEEKKEREEYIKNELKRFKDVQMFLFAMNSAKTHISRSWPNGFLTINKQICAKFTRVDNIVTITVTQEENANSYSWTVNFSEVEHLYK